MFVAKLFFSLPYYKIKPLHIFTSQNNNMKFTDKQLKLLDERYVRGGDLKNAYMHVSHSSHGSPLHITGTWLRNHNGYITSSWDIKGNVKD